MGLFKKISVSLLSFSLIGGLIFTPAKANAAENTNANEYENTKGITLDINSPDVK